MVQTVTLSRLEVEDLIRQHLAGKGFTIKGIKLKVKAKRAGDDKEPKVDDFFGLFSSAKAEPKFVLEDIYCEAEVNAE